MHILYYGCHVAKPIELDINTFDELPVECNLKRFVRGQVYYKPVVPRDSHYPCLVDENGNTIHHFGFPNVYSCYSYNKYKEGGNCFYLRNDEVFYQVRTGSQWVLRFENSQIAEQYFKYLFGDKIFINRIPRAYSLQLNIGDYVEFTEDCPVYSIINNSMVLTYKKGNIIRVFGFIKNAKGEDCIIPSPVRNLNEFSYKSGYTCLIGLCFIPVSKIKKTDNIQDSLPWAYENEQIIYVNPDDIKDINNINPDLIIECDK